MNKIFICIGICFICIFAFIARSPGQSPAGMRADTNGSLLWPPPAKFFNEPTNVVEINKVITRYIYNTNLVHVRSGGTASVAQDYFYYPTGGTWTNGVNTAYIVFTASTTNWAIVNPANQVAFNLTSFSPNSSAWTVQVGGTAPSPQVSWDLILTNVSNTFPPPQGTNEAARLFEVQQAQAAATAAAQIAASNAYPAWVFNAGRSNLLYDLRIPPPNKDIFAKVIYKLRLTNQFGAGLTGAPPKPVTVLVCGDSMSDPGGGSRASITAYLFKELINLYGYKGQKLGGGDFNSAGLYSLTNPLPFVRIANGGTATLETTNGTQEGWQSWNTSPFTMESPANAPTAANMAEITWYADANGSTNSVVIVNSDGPQQVPVSGQQLNYYTNGGPAMRSASWSFVPSRSNLLVVTGISASNARTNITMGVSYTDTNGPGIITCNYGLGSSSLEDFVGVNGTFGHGMDTNAFSDLWKIVKPDIVFWVHRENSLSIGGGGSYSFATYSNNIITALNLMRGGNTNCPVVVVQAPYGNTGEPLESYLAWMTYQIVTNQAAINGMWTMANLDPNYSYHDWDYTNSIHDGTHPGQGLAAMEAHQLIAMCGLDQPRYDGALNVPGYLNVGAQLYLNQNYTIPSAAELAAHFSGLQGSTLTVSNSASGVPTIWWSYTTNSIDRVDILLAPPAPKRIRQYVALLTQTGTGAPTAIIQTNDFPFAPTYARSSAGIYTVTANTLFLTNHTAISFGMMPDIGGETNVCAIGNIVSTNLIRFSTKITDGANAAFGPLDNQFQNTEFRITVYPP